MKHKKKNLFEKIIISKYIKGIVALILVLVVSSSATFAAHIFSKSRNKENFNKFLINENTVTNTINEDESIFNSSIALSLSDIQKKLEEDLNNKTKQEEEAKIAAEAQAKAQAEETKSQEQISSGNNANTDNSSRSKTNNNSSGQNSSSAQSQSFVAQLNVANQTDQIIVVKGNGGSSATVSLHKKVNGVWNQILSTGGNVGLNGITNNKREGDRKTPAGVYSLGIAFGMGGNPGTSLSYRQINNNDYWVDDSNSSHYNQWVNTSNTPKDWNSAEHLASYQSQYAYGIVVNYNTSCTPGLGSAIFLHCSTGSGTYGCISVPRSVLVSIMQNINSNCLIVIASGDNIYNY